MGIGNHLIGDLEQRLCVQALQRRSLFRMTGAASQCWRAEAEIQEMYPGMHCRLLPSATAGLALILELLQLEPGKEVLVTPFGWLSNWSCIRRAGLIPRFLPLDSNLQVRSDDVAERVSEQTGAVIVTHLMGRGQQAVHDIAQLCSQWNVPLLEDIAQSFGVAVNGRRAGSFGLASWCSLNHHKVLSTGDGGFVLTSDDQLFERLSALHDQGCIVTDGKRYPAPMLEPGLSLRASELMAAVLRAQLARFHFIRARILSHQAAVAAACKEELALRVLEPHNGDLPFTVLFERPPAIRYPPLIESGWHVAPSVPWLADSFSSAARTDPALAATIRNLAAVSAVGAGFVDPYYAVPLGLSITEPSSDASSIVAALQEQLL